MFHGGFLRRSAQRLRDATGALRGEGTLALSNLGEDLLLRDLFANVPSGYYVDVGCHRPRRDSLTWPLYRTGWRGLAVDANPRLVRRFRRARPRDDVVHAGVLPQPGQRPFHLHGDSSGNSFLEEWMDASSGAPDRASRRTRDIEVPCTTLDRLLEEHVHPNVGIDLLKIDVEGLDEAILLSLDLERWRPNVICVEVHQRFAEDLMASRLGVRLGGMGYALMGFNRRNAILATRDYANQNVYSHHASIYETAERLRMDPVGQP